MVAFLLNPSKRRIALGIGCDRATDVSEISALIDLCLAKVGFGQEAIQCLATVDLKAQEEALIALAVKMAVPLSVFDVVTLEAETPRLASPSVAVFRAIGCHGVAEAAALAAVGPVGKLILPKQRTAHATCAIAAFPSDAGHS